MSAAHTPGPWEVTRTTLSWYVIPAGGHMGNAVASGILPAHTFHMAKAEKDATGYMADARLIAAAPDLLAALNSLYELCLHGDFRNGVTDSTGTIDEGDSRAGERIDAARAAIAKATGS